MSTHLQPEPTRRARRAGGAAPASVAGAGLGSAIVNGVLWYLLNESPGWRAVPFLTDGFTRVLDAVNAALVAAIVVGIATMVLRLPRLRALGDLVTIGFGVVALGALWSVFPFAFDVDSAWTTVTRVLLVVGFVGCGLGVLDALARLVTGRR